MYRLIRHNLLLFVIPWAIGLAIAVFAPDDVLTRFSGLRSFVDVLSVLVPSLRIVDSHSQFPEITTFYHGVMWLFVPLWTLQLLRSMLRRDGAALRDDAILYLDNLSLKNLSLFVLMGLLCACIVIYLWAFDADRDVFGTRFNSSRLFLGFFGGIFPLTGSFAIATLIFQGWSVLHRLGIVNSTRRSK